MGILSSLLGKIFPSSHAANRGQATAGQGQPSPGGQAQAQQTATPSQAANQPTGQQSTSGSQAAAAQTVDIEQVLNEKASQNSQKLNWRTSIVDLMKLVGMDSSLNARKELAQELNYTGDMNDSAAMNIWLHKQVMKKLAENGGKVPQDLLH
jgi:hypothetical protein